jgi:hypothetical protein
LLLAFPRYAEKARELRLSGLPLVRAEGPSEAAESWYMLFRAFAEAYKTFTGESAKIASIIIDQNHAAPKAAKKVDEFKEAIICNDVVHLYRAVEEKHKDKRRRMKAPTADSKHAKLVKGVSKNAAKAAEAAGEPLPAIDDLALDDEPITLSD